MSVVEIESELKKMTNSERLVVIEIAAKLIRDESGEIRRLTLTEKRARLKKSAEIMLAEYSENENLTEITVLDSEDFLDA
jgi:ABC-type uncharacterized transport system auxiliary subunit